MKIMIPQMIIIMELLSLPLPSFNPLDVDSSHWLYLFWLSGSIIRGPSWIIKLLHDPFV